MAKIKNDFSRNYTELIILLSFAKLNPQYKNRIAYLASQISNWDVFFDLIETNAVLFLSCQRLEEVTDFSSQHRFSALQKKMQKIKERTTNQFKLLTKMLLKMSEEGIEVIVLKGSLFAHTLYESHIYKKMNDIDILVKFEHAQKASFILQDLGFKCVSETLFSKEQFSPTTHHSPPYIHLEQKIITGIHWGIHAIERQFCANIEGIWQRKVAISINTIPAYRMSWEDNLLHLCMHLPFYKTGLRELADVYNVILFAAPKIDWDIFLKRSREWNACESVYRVLALTNALLQSVYATDIDNGLLKGLHLKEKISFVMEDCKVRSSHVYIKDTEARIASVETLLSSRSTYISKIEKSLFVFRMSENYFEKLNAIVKMWLFVLFPPTIEMRKISYPWFTEHRRRKKLFNYIRARVTTPIRIIRALNDEHGTKTIFLLTLQNVIIIFWDTLTLSFFKRRPSIINTEYKSILKDLE